MKNFRVIAILAAYNEEDIIAQVVAHLIEEGVSVYFLDNESTDGTVKAVKPFLGKGLLRIERFSGSAPADQAQTATFAWERILRRKEELSRELDADWFIHQDADEFRESPWSDRTLAEAIQVVDRLGYNAIDFAVLNFWPTNDRFRTGDDVRTGFRYYDAAQSFDRLQIKCWKKTTAVVDLAATGGHDARFAARRVFPVRFLLRHYPIRGQRHGERKVFIERRARFDAGERARGWHVQYDGIDADHNFLRNPAELTVFDPEAVRLELVLHHRRVEELELQIVELEQRLDTQRQDHSALLGSREQELEESKVQRATLERRIGSETAQFIETLAMREGEIVSLRSALEQSERDALQRIERLTSELAEQSSRRSALEEGERENGRRIEGLTRELSETESRRSGLEESERENQQRIESLAGELAGVRAALGAREDELRARTAQLTGYLSSRSWRLTSPLRWVYDHAFDARSGPSRNPKSTASGGFGAPAVPRAVSGIRMVPGIAGRAWRAWREGRLPLSPSRWAADVRQYIRESRSVVLPPPPPVPPPVTDLRPVPVTPEAGVIEPALPVHSGPRFLVITDVLPTHDQDAGSFRMYQMLKLLREIGFDVALISHSENRPERYVAAMSQLGIFVHCGAAQALDHLKSEGHLYQYVILSRPEMALRYLFPVRAYAIHAVVAYDTVDLHWLRMSRAFAITGDRETERDARYYRRIEHLNAASADLVLAATPADKEAILEDQPGVRVEVLSTIHPDVAAAGGWQERQGLMFIGGFWHRPNEDAVCWFVTEILPRIQKQLRGVDFFIIGSNMSEKVKALASGSVHAIGFVDDPASYFDRSRVFVCPLRYGAGMKGKLGQSMSHGLPAVTTTIGAEGMGLVDEATALIADDPEAFARAVVRLYTDEPLWTRVADGGRAHVAEHFSPSAAGERLRQVFPPDVRAPATRAAGAGN